MASQHAYKRKISRIFASVFVAVFALEIAFFAIEYSLSSVETEHRRALSSAAQQTVRVEQYERATYLAVSALAASEWELLIAQRRSAEAISTKFITTERALGDDPNVSEALQADLSRALERWDRVVAGHLRLMRANNHELRDNPALAEFRAEVAALLDDLNRSMALLRADHRGHLRRLDHIRDAMPIMLLVLTLCMALAVFYGLVTPLGDTMDQLQASQQQLEAAHDALEERIAERTQTLSETNQQLQDQGEILESVLESMGEGLLVAGPDQSVRMWNAEAEYILGARPRTADLAGWSAICDSSHSDGSTIDDGELPIQHALSGRAIASEMFVRTAERRDGIWLSWTARPIAAPDQEPQGAVAVFRDVTRRKRADDELKRANDELEQRVEERTRELRDAHKQIVDSALAAGKAEVATNILHNVGNVLNGVNVLTEITRERLQLRQWQALSRVADLIDHNRDDLARFFTDDPRGQQMPDYMIRIARRQEDERQSILARVDRLAEQIEHIKRIVHLQQEHARSVDLNEDAALAEVIETALDINLPGLERHGIQIFRTFEPMPTVFVQKHKLLQILVNLISNAKYAMADVAREHRRLDVRLSRTEHGWVRIAVTDNGCGIAPELLTRIFQHGFSTRDDGHGFGLHASVLAAQQLGGALRGDSDGVGRGATFVLDLPITRP